MMRFRGGGAADGRSGSAGALVSRVSRVDLASLPVDREIGRETVIAHVTRLWQFGAQEVLRAWG
jgi:hypothetical protein